MKSEYLNLKINFNAMNKINELKQELASKNNQMVELNKRAIDSSRVKTEDEKSLFGKLEKESTELEERISDLEKNETLNKRGGVESKRATQSEDEPKPEVMQFRGWLNEYINGATTAPFKFRADPWITSTDAGIIGKQPKEISLLTSPGLAFAGQLGLTVLTNAVNTGNITLPSMGEADAVIASESGDASTANMAGASVTLAPKRFTHFQTISRETIVQNSDLLNKVYANLVAGVDNKIMLQFFDDLETDAATQVFAHPTTVNKITNDLVLALEASVGGLGIGPAGYVADFPLAGYLKGTIALGTTAGPAMWSNKELNGTPAYPSRYGNTDMLYYSSDWSQGVISSWGEPTIIVDEVTRAKQGEVVLTIIKMADTGIWNKRAFCFIDASTR